MSKLVPLSDGKAYARVDDADFERLMAHDWHVASTDYASYARRATDGAWLYMHRELLGSEVEEVDHINGDGLDNRRANLRAVTRAQNAQNQRTHRGGTSRFRGVYFNRSRGGWMARVKLNYRHHYLGTFDDELDAARVAEAFRKEHMPFARPDPELEVA